MKSIIRSLVVVVAVAAVAGGATYSVFSSTDTITGNTIGVSTVKLDAKGESNATTMAKPLVSEALSPGELSDWARGALFNQSSVPVDVYMYIDNVSGDACDDLALKVTTGHAANDASERAVVVYNDELTGLEGSGNRIQVNTASSPFPSGIPAGITQVIQQQAQLDENAPDSTQGQTCSWDEVFVAETIPEE